MSSRSSIREVAKCAGVSRRATQVKVADGAFQGPGHLALAVALTSLVTPQVSDSSPPAANLMSHPEFCEREFEERSKQDPTGQTDPS